MARMAVAKAAVKVKEVNCILSLAWDLKSDLKFQEFGKGRWALGVDLGCCCCCFTLDDGFAADEKESLLGIRGGFYR